jgi:hypothetical protein
MKYVGFTEIEGFEELEGDASIVGDDASILGDDSPVDEHDVASRATRAYVNGTRNLYL